MAAVAPSSSSRVEDWTAIQAQLSQQWKSLGVEATLVPKGSRPAYTFREHVFDAMRMIRKRLEREFGTRVAKAEVLAFRYSEPNDDTLEFSVLHCLIRNGTPEECANATDWLMDFILDNFDNDVRRGIAVEIFGTNG